MTAQEIIDEYEPSILSGTHVKRYGQVAIKEMMEEYARQKCKEQRELCSKELNTRYTIMSKVDKVRNAPEPTFD